MGPLSPTLPTSPLIREDRNCCICKHIRASWLILILPQNLCISTVTELAEGDSSRKIVEIICKTSWVKSEKHNHLGRIEKVLKVHNTQRTLSRFEEYRESVKKRASKLPKKHLRCLADGNELLRFYGTTLSCSLVSFLCFSPDCCVCRIIRNGCTAREEAEAGKGVGIFTVSTSGRAFESVEIEGKEEGMVRKVLMVCRLIAGRVHRPLENVRDGGAGWV